LATSSFRTREILEQKTIAIRARQGGPGKR
jgi:hypothetical protein